MNSQRQGINHGPLPPESSAHPMPIIVGVPRSGTTLLRLMLDTHPELAVTHEAGFIPMVSNLTNPLSRMAYRRLKTAASARSWADSLRIEFYRTLTEMETWNDFHVPGDALKQSLKEIVPFTVSEGVRAFFRLYARRFAKPRWGDKTPFYNRYLQTVENTLPEAHFIHIIRDGRDAALSGQGLSFAGKDLEAIGRKWRSDILLTRKQSKVCRRYMEIRYEDLVLRTTDSLQKICQFIDLTYEPCMERYYLTARERMDEFENTYDRAGRISETKESRFQRHRLTTQPPEPSRIGRWKTEMPKDDVAKFNQFAGDLLTELGYDK